jgi:hypothetical protein
MAQMKTTMAQMKTRNEGKQERIAARFHKLLYKFLYKFFYL